MLELLAQSLLIALRRDRLPHHQLPTSSEFGPSGRRNRHCVYDDIPEWERR